MTVRHETLSNRTVAALTVERDTVFWDRNLTGFGVRVYPSGGKVYIAQARERTGKKLPKRVTIGRHDVLNAEQARRRAALIIARIRAGEEPLPLPLAAMGNGGPTVADLAARYLEEHAAVRLKPGSQTLVEILIRCHILPALGRMPLAVVEQRHVIELQQGLSAQPVTANKAVKLLSHMYRLGEGWGLAPEGRNPCRSVEKYPERSRERFLTDAEFTRLGQVLDRAAVEGGASPKAVAAIRLLMLTGCRKSEILTLRWSDVDLDAKELRLADAKAGPAPFTCRRWRWSYWKRCRDGRAAPGCSPATTGTDATAAAASTMSGRPSAPGPDWRTSGCTTFATPLRPAPWRLGRPCR